MKALAGSERRGFERYVSQQVYYSLVGRELEHELVPLALDQGVGILVWSPLAGGFLTGKYRRGEQGPDGARRTHSDEPPIDLERGFEVVAVAAEIASARGVSVAQVALNWLVRKPWVSSVIIGARREEQLRDNLAAASWTLSDEELARLDEVSEPPVPYPYWHQRGSARNGLPALGAYLPSAAVAPPERITSP
jgi:aryl-alcohol dehydrogenase-like predicted oxidoreductase